MTYNLFDSHLFNVHTYFSCPTASSLQTKPFFFFLQGLFVFSCHFLSSPSDICFIWFVLRRLCLLKNLKSQKSLQGFKQAAGQRRGPALSPVAGLTEPLSWQSLLCPQLLAPTARFPCQDRVGRIWSPGTQADRNPAPPLMVPLWCLLRWDSKKTTFALKLQFMSCFFP